MIYRLIGTGIAGGLAWWLWTRYPHVAGFFAGAAILNATDLVLENVSP